jgi:hypothetical protein
VSLCSVCVLRDSRDGDDGDEEGKCVCASIASRGSADAELVCTGPWMARVMQDVCRVMRDRRHEFELACGRALVNHATAGWRGEAPLLRSQAGTCSSPHRLLLKCLLLLPLFLFADLGARPLHGWAAFHGKGQHDGAGAADEDHRAVPARGHVRRTGRAGGEWGPEVELSPSPSTFSYLWLLLLLLCRPRNFPLQFPPWIVLE